MSFFVGINPTKQKATFTIDSPFLETKKKGEKTKMKKNIKQELKAIKSLEEFKKALEDYRKTQEK